MDRVSVFKQLLSRGVTETGCLFCNGDCDTLIIRGSKKEQSFNLPFPIDIPKYIRISYKQNGNLILEKTLNDVTISSFDNSLIYYSLSEQETLKFSAGDTVLVQLRAMLEDKHVITSETYYVDVIDVVDDRQMTSSDPEYWAIDAEINNQNIKVNQYYDLITYSNIYKAKFLFDSTWDKFIKIARFKDDYNHFVNVNIEENNGEYYCKIPDLLLENPGWLHLEVTGILKNGDNNFVKPTTWSNAILVKRGGISTGEFDSVLKSAQDRYIYCGVSTDAYKINSLQELTAIDTNRFKLLSEGLEYKGYNLDYKFNVIAVPKVLGIYCYELEQNGFSVIPTKHMSTDSGNYTFYYFSSPSIGEFTCKYKFKGEE